MTAKGLAPPACDQSSATLAELFQPGFANSPLLTILMRSTITTRRGSGKPLMGSLLLLNTSALLTLRDDEPGAGRLACEQLKALPLQWVG